MKTLTTSELSFRSGRVKLLQLEHLENSIKDTAADGVYLIESFDLWQQYVTAPSGQMALYAQQDWKHINSLIEIIEKQTCDWVYMAVNRYLLLSDPNPEAPLDWDQAILEYFQTNLKKYSVVDYQYQQLNYAGAVGNFISPDNRFLCKKVK
jgi:hypothetical protein